ncbi:SDR family oxidoreductase [Cytophagaceae bacterium DM2B3-1]|uniref:SDR family oxidoreductase n=1 Tax=Xanthocytophaga flava TaxID=3048013 RepID=A0ABT7CUB1_9BACT|nr:SDR family oxidoreductase [Xanthocytophaga flavus]MDJ1497355.1 SDR family oxidoreductase [Xanthocytophaga flavus]
MKLIIFGATGSVGSQLVKQALDQGHSVTAFTRSPEKLATFAHDNLQIIKGDLQHATDVENAIRNQDAVLCAIGDGANGKVRATGTRHILDAMQKTGSKRFICQTTLGLGNSAGNLNFFWKYIMFGWLLKKAFQDHQIQERYIFDSSLDYTVVRPSAFTNGSVTNTYKVDFDGNYKKLSLKISRADVANFMLQQLQNRLYSRKAVSISN